MSVGQDDGQAGHHGSQRTSSYHTGCLPRGVRDHKGVLGVHKRGLTCVVLNEPISVNCIRLANSARKDHMSVLKGPTYAVRLERAPGVLLIAYGGLSRLSPAWLGAPRFAWPVPPSPRMAAVGLGGAEVREGGKPFAAATPAGSLQGYGQNYPTNKKIR
jgi:hypothetical protein